MTLQRYQWLAAAVVLTLALVGDTASARGRAGGGGRASGGGGSRSMSRSSYSGSGSVRYSSPSRSYSRPSTPSYSRPSTPAYRPSTPSVSQRPSGGSSYARPSTPTYRPSTPSVSQRPVGGSSFARPTTPSYRPSNSGSIIHSGSITTPGGATIGGIRGPGGGGAVGIKGSDGGTAGAIRGPGGGGAAGIQGPGGGSAGAVRGPGGGGAAAVQGPGGGTAGAVRGPGGAGAAGVRGPGGAAAGAVRGPAGGGAVGVRGPGGAGAGAVWGPGGRGVAGVRGPYGNRFITNLPSGCVHYPWRGGNYWYFGFSWWRPCWVGDSVSYVWAYPPVGYYYPTLPDNYETVVINNNTYYEAEGVYYQQGEQDGKKGYVVAEAPVVPEEPAADQGENPFPILKSMCDYVGGLQSFGVLAYATTDEIRESGERVQVSARRILNVNRPDKFSIDVSGDKGMKLCVYDGKTISLLDRTQGIYAVVEVPNTIEGALDKLAKDYGIVIPFQDLMYKDLYDRLEARTTAGQYLGLHTVDGVKCHHLAFSTETTAWEIWIDAGETPIPRKLTIAYGQDAAKSRATVDIRGWTAETPAARSFDFKVPEGVKRMELTPTTAEAAK